MHTRVHAHAHVHTRTHVHAHSPPWGGPSGEQDIWSPGVGCPGHKDVNSAEKERAENVALARASRGPPPRGTVVLASFPIRIERPPPLPLRREGNAFFVQRARPPDCSGHGRHTAPHPDPEGARALRVHFLTSRRKGRSLGGSERSRRPSSHVCRALPGAVSRCPETGPGPDTGVVYAPVHSDLLLSCQQKRPLSQEVAAGPPRWPVTGRVGEHVGDPHASRRSS